MCTFELRIKGRLSEPVLCQTLSTSASAAVLKNDKKYIIMTDICMQLL